MATHTGTANRNDILGDRTAASASRTSPYSSLGADRSGDANLFALTFTAPSLAVYRRSPGDPGYGGMPLATVFGSLAKTVGLEWLAYEAGDYYLDDFAVANPTTGFRQNADALPLATVYRIDGTGTLTVSSDMTLTVVAIDTGGYVCYGTIPSTWQRGDVICVSAYLVVAGKAQKIPVSTFVIGGLPQTGLAWPARMGPGFLVPGGYYLDQFAVIRPDTVMVADADITPTLTVYRRDGASGAMAFTTAMTLTLTHEDAGRYVITGAIPSAWSRKDVVIVRALVTIGGKTQIIPVSSFVLSGIPLAGLAWP